MKYSFFDGLKFLMPGVAERYSELAVQSGNSAAQQIALNILTSRRLVVVGLGLGMGSAVLATTAYAYIPSVHPSGESRTEKVLRVATIAFARLAVLGAIVGTTMYISGSYGVFKNVVVRYFKGL